MQKEWDAMITNGQLVQTKYWLEHELFDVNDQYARTDVCYRTPLITALSCYDNHAKIPMLKLLLDHGANPNLPSFNNKACYMCARKSVLWLFLNEMDKYRFGWTSSARIDEVLKMLINLGAEVHNSSCAQDKTCKCVEYVKNDYAYTLLLGNPKTPLIVCRSKKEFYQQFVDPKQTWTNEMMNCIKTYNGIDCSTRWKIVVRFNRRVDSAQHAVLTLLCIHKYHRDNIGRFFGRDIVLIICKNIWNSRRECVWDQHKTQTKRKK